MAPIHTHYDNLKVARNASPETIREAYKKLSLKYHPDRNLGGNEATRIMAIINASYDVLSNPDKRQEHDQWITDMEGTIKNNMDQQPIRHFTNTNFTYEPAPPSPQSSALSKCLLLILNMIKMFFRWVFSYFVYAVAAALIIGFIRHADYIFSGGKLYAPISKKYQDNNDSSRMEYVRPMAAPNGQPWPVSASYIAGYEKLHVDGLSTVTIDNSQNDSDVFVKLVSLDNTQAYPVRQFYIPAFGVFILNKVTAGNYDIRYRNLNNGHISRSEAFSLEEIPTYNGTQFSNISMTLYKVQNGNMHTYNLSDEDF